MRLCRMQSRCILGDLYMFSEAKKYLSDPGQESMRGWSLASALRLSIALSNKSDEEVAAEMGWSKSVENRFFHNQNYWPSLPTLPRYCRVVGNSVLLQWVLDNVEAELAQVQPMTAPEMLRHLQELIKELAEVLAEGQTALADHVIHPQEARRIIRELTDLFRVGASMMARLQAVIDAARVG